jgi:hypothetical protein
VAIRGTPDLLICCKGVFVSCELKADAKSKIAALQLHVKDQIEKAKGRAWVVYPENFEEFKAFMTELSCG